MTKIARNLKMVHFTDPQTHNIIYVKSSFQILYEYILIIKILYGLFLKIIKTIDNCKKKKKKKTIIP